MDIEQELLNTQKRVNILTNAITDMFKVVSCNNPDYIREQLGQIVEQWEKQEDLHPMGADNG